MAAVVLARLKVQDYDRWRAVFDSNTELRKSAGCLGTHIFRNADDGNDVTINFQWDTAENARAFIDGPDAQKAREASGVTGFDYWLVEDAGRTPS